MKILPLCSLCGALRCAPVSAHNGGSSSHNGIVSGEHMRKRFAPPRRRRVSSSAPADLEKSESLDNLALTEALEASEAFEAPMCRWHGTHGLKQIALDLWAPDYSVLFEAEFAYNSLACGSGGYDLLPSTYRARLHGEAAERYDWRRKQQKRDEMAIALHANNMQRWSPSLLARSVAYFNLTTAFMHGEETRQRRLASRPTTMQFLRLMRDCRPLAEWEKASHVSFYVADQTYEWVGMKKRGRRNTLERLDPTGMPVAIEHEVYINSVKLELPQSLGTLSPAELLTIASNHGSPYTEDYNLVFVPLQPVTVLSSLATLARDALAPVSAAAAAEGVTPANLTLRMIATALYGRPNIDPGGPSEFEILEPLMRTDTKSYDDFVKITQHLSSHSGAACVVDIFCGDGQSVISFKNLKKRWPSRYAKWLISVGGFHEHAHTMFAFTEMFYSCFFCFCLMTMHIERVQRVTMDLEHNSYAHHQAAHHATTIAVVGFLLQDVREPPPALLLRDIDAYLERLEAAGGIVLVQYLKHAGIPTLQWQRAARCGDGAKLKVLFAYSFHIFRSVCHKTNCTQIALIALLGFCCALPALQTVLLATISLSLLGRKGSNMYCDRLVETINKLQQGTKRSSSDASFQRAIDLTSLLRSMLHVRHAFQAAEHGDAETDDPVTASMLVQARVLQDAFLRLLGRDLTQPAPQNPFWHTGNPVTLTVGEFREYRPWEWIERAADGRSAGRGRAKSERWDLYVRRFVFEHFFPY